MGFFDKLKSFGSKVITGFRKGWDWVKNKATPVIKRLWGPAKQIVDSVIPGAKPITDAVEGFGKKYGPMFGLG